MHGGELQFSDVELVRSLTEHEGNYHQVARSLNVTRGAIQKRVKASPELAALVHDLREGGLDDTVSQLDAAARRGEPWAVQFKLKTQGKSRGYYERSEVSILMEQLKAIEDVLNERGVAVSSRENPPLIGEGGSTAAIDDAI